MSIFTGMRGTSGFEADGTFKRRPENWREMILMLYPNGKTPLTALTSKIGSEKTDDPIFHWFEKEFPAQNGTVTGVYTDALTTAWTAAAKTVGDAVYIKMAAADVTNFKSGHVVIVRATASSDLTKNIFQVLVTAAPTVNGASSYITGKLLGTFTSLASASYTAVVAGGTAYAEGDTLGTAIAYDPTDYANYTQIFRNSLEATRTASKTRLRTGDAVAQAKKEALELQGVEMERAFFFNGAKYITTGSNGQPLRVTAGVRGFIATNKWDFRAATSIGSTTWCDTQVVTMKTFNWLMTNLEQVFRYGSADKVGFCGSGVLLGLQQMVANLPGGQINLSSETVAYGWNVNVLKTPFGNLEFLNHPLFTLDAAYRYDMIVLDTKYLKYRYVDDTSYKPDRGANDLDGSKSEFLTEAGLEVNFEKSHAIINGIGQGATS